MNSSIPCYHLIILIWLLLLSVTSKISGLHSLGRRFEIDSLRRNFLDNSIQQTKATVQTENNAFPVHCNAFDIISDKCMEPEGFFLQCKEGIDQATEVCIPDCFLKRFSGIPAYVPIITYYQSKNGIIYSLEQELLILISV